MYVIPNPANTGPADIYLVDQTTGSVVAQVTVTMPGASSPGFIYANLSSPFTLIAGRQYALSGYSAQIPFWSDQTPVSVRDFKTGGACYSTSGPGGSYQNSSANSMFLGVDLVYSVPGTTPPTGTKMLTGWTPGTARTENYFWVGAYITPTTNLTVDHLGCYVWPGNTGTVYLYLVEQSGAGNIIAQAQADMTAPSANGFTYGSIAPVTLVAGSPYVVSADSSTMANWSENSGATYNSLFTPKGAVYTQSVPSGIYTLAGTPANYQYVGVDLVLAPPAGSGAPTGAAVLLAGL
jgi:hypothetical protein